MRWLEALLRILTRAIPAPAPAPAAPRPTMAPLPQPEPVKLEGAPPEPAPGPPAAQAPPDPADLIPDDYWPMLAKIESGNRPYVRAQTSSASGLYQFIKATWINEGGKWGPDTSAAFGGLRPSVEEQTARARSFTAKNARMLVKAGLPINKASLYAAHFLGVMGAIKIIRADVSTPIESVTAAAQRVANPSILGGEKTVADFLSWLHRKTGDWAR